MEKLTQTEEDVMQAIWRVGEGNIKSFLPELADPPPYTTLASTVKNLEKKGYLKSRLLGNTYIYSPAVSEELYKQRFMGSVVKDYFSNSYKEMVSFFIEKQKISAEELKELIGLIEGKK